ncbi:MAG: peptidoglycan-binding domain-containing protein [Pseudomonadota bacterium]
MAHRFASFFLAFSLIFTTVAPSVVEAQQPTRYEIQQRKERERALRLNRTQREEIEWRLNRAGYWPGSINGEFNRDTRKAIRAYRKDAGLTPHNFLDRRMLRYLVDDTGGNRRYENGEDYDAGDVALGVAAGALIIGGIILLAD